jgi:uncharacterized membrane protein YoaK (UPF0700 family)
MTTASVSARGVANTASAWRALRSDPAHGPLPVLLVGLTVLTGVVDAVSILSLGRVFVANMTGNVVFIGFALTGAAGFSLAASLAALAGFLIGAGVGGRLVRRFGDDRAVLLAAGVAIELALIVAALIVIQAVEGPITPAVGAVVAAVMAVGTGIQNAVVRRLAVPDMTTTVLTMTLTGIAADIRAGNASRALKRRLLAVGAMLGGAVAGSELVLHQGASAALALAIGLLAVVTVGAGLAASQPGDWRHAAAIAPSTHGPTPVTTHGEKGERP